MHHLNLYFQRKFSFRLYALDKVAQTFEEEGSETFEDLDI